LRDNRSLPGREKQCRGARGVARPTRASTPNEPMESSRSVAPAEARACRGRRRRAREPGGRSRVRRLDLVRLCGALSSPDRDRPRSRSRAPL